MEQLTEADWVEFHQMVEAAGPSLFNEEPTSIVFRGGSEQYTIDFVRKPYFDALKIRDMLDKDPTLFGDSGFQTILPLAKSVEMHMRLLYMGAIPEDFQNTSFHLSKCCKAIISGHSEFNGMGDKKVIAKGVYWENVSPEDSRRRPLTTKAFQIYNAGNPYRHNRVQSWVEVRPKFVKILGRFEEFMQLFDKLVK